jgi:bifunctional non-homologous end joining protein LigD
MILNGRDVMAETLDARKDLLESEVLRQLGEPIRCSPALPGSVADLVRSIRLQGLEGLIAERRNSRYKSGGRSGAWLKMRVNRGQEFVIGGYTIDGSTFDALVFGYYAGKDLIYVARTRNGFTPKIRSELMKRFSPLETDKFPFVNLPEERSGRWGAGLTATKMGDCRWLRPWLVGELNLWSGPRTIICGIQHSLLSVTISLRVMWSGRNADPTTFLPDSHDQASAWEIRHSSCCGPIRQVSLTWLE